MLSQLYHLGRRPGQQPRPKHGSGTERDIHDDTGKIGIITPYKAKIQGGLGLLPLRSPLLGQSFFFLVSLEYDSFRYTLPSFLFFIFNDILPDVIGAKNREM